jgi:putative protease
MFSPTRDQARKFLMDAWRKRREALPATPLETMAADIIGLHPEYHALLESGEDALSRDWSPDQGDTNPFLHLSLHLSIAEQLQIDQPPRHPSRLSGTAGKIRRRPRRPAPHPRLPWPRPYGAPSATSSPSMAPPTWPACRKRRSADPPRIAPQRPPLHPTIKKFMTTPTPRRTPELLAPVGSLQMLETAFRFGADAIYAGQPRYSLRVRNNDFGRIENLAKGIDRAHALGKQFFVVSNIFPHNAKIKTYLADMAPVIALKPDALIMADPGLIHMIREAWPEMPIHLSVQANTVNYAAIRFWKSIGISRVILSRELSLDEVAEIRQECPDMELEVFVHGAPVHRLFRSLPALRLLQSSRSEPGHLHQLMPLGLLGHSHGHRCRRRRARQRPQPGRLWLVELTAALRPGRSHLATGRKNAPGRADAHRGRRARHLHPQQQGPACHRAHTATGGHRRRFVEDRRPHQIALLRRPYLPKLPPGHRRCRRGPPPRSAPAERTGRPRPIAATPAASTNATRIGEYQNYLKGHSESNRSLYVGDVTAYADGWAEIEVKNRFAVGDRLEFVTPGGNLEVRIDAMQNRKGEPIDVAPRQRPPRSHPRPGGL